ncbi:MAG: hypothetical protein R3B12_03375 [Candidatus Saccharimonadales bacterium]
MATIVRGGGDNAAMVAVDRTGKVLAMVGGRDFEYPGYGQINYATTPRSPRLYLQTLRLCRLDDEVAKLGPR